MNRLSISRLVALCLVAALVLSGCSFGGPVPPTTYTVSGRVVDLGGTGIQGVVLTCTGGASTTTTSLSNGSWSITGLKGTVTITPRKDGWVFDPVYKVVTSAQKDIKFTGTRLFQLTTQVSGEGQITKDPDKTVYHQGESVSVTACAAQGWEFSHWEGDLTGTASTVTVTMGSSKSVTAVFVRSYYRLDVKIVGEGQVTEEVIVDSRSGSFEYKSEVRLTAVPDTGWVFDCWEGDITGSANPVTIAVDSDKTVTAVFTAISYMINTSVQGDGEIELDPKESAYVYGEQVTVIALPAPGWTFSHWEGDITEPDNIVTLVVTGNIAVTAVFARIQYDLNVTVVGQGQVTEALVVPDKSSSYEYESVVRLTAIPDPGWEFTRWEGDVTGSDNPVTLTIDSDKSITAVFTPVHYTITTDTEGSGSIQRDPDKDTYNYNESVELTAIPEENWKFSHWEGSITGTANPETLVVTNSAHIKAVFARIQHDLNIAIVGQGEVTEMVGDQVTSGTYDQGSEVRLTAVPTTGWAFDRWEGDVTGSDNPATVIMDSDKNVTAVFTATAAYTITTSTDGNGTIVLTPGEGPYSYGDEVHVEAVPDAGWELYLWSGDLSGNANPTVLTVTGDMSIGAQFVSDDYLGLGLGARWEYHYDRVYESVTYSGWAIEEVVERFNHDGIRMYKVRAWTDLHASDPPFGFFRGRSGDTHYEFGSWSDDPGMSGEYWYPVPSVIVTKPVHVGDAGFTDKEAVRQESVAVDAGTYEAWVFHSEGDPGDGSSIETDIWFVQCIGAVKSHEVITRTDPDTGGEIIDVYTVELVSYTPGTL